MLRPVLRWARLMKWLAAYVAILTIGEVLVYAAGSRHRSVFSRARSAGIADDAVRDAVGGVGIAIRLTPG